MGIHSPLKDRILTQTASGCLESSSATSTTHRPSSYKDWTEHKMRKALSTIESGMSVNRAAVIYGIPRTTLNDCKLGKVHPGAQPGRPTLLSTKEEEDIVESKQLQLGMVKQGKMS